MKRSNSRGLDELFQVVKKQHAGAPRAGHKQQNEGPRASGRRFGLASSGLQRTGSVHRSGSLQMPDGAAASGTSASGTTGSGRGPSGAVTAAGAYQGLPEVCSPPPAKLLNFLAPPEVALSPFKGAESDAAAVMGAPPAALTRWRRGRAPSDGGTSGDSESDSDDEDGEGSMQEDQENLQPCSAAAAAPAPATWLVSPLTRGGGAAGGERPAASAPLVIPSPSPAGTSQLLFSPGGGLPTPAKEAAIPFQHPPPTLVHAPSFSSWMVPASRPPSPPHQRAQRPCATDVSDVINNVLGDVKAARRFGRSVSGGFGGGFGGGGGFKRSSSGSAGSGSGGGGRPSGLDFLLGEIGDTHYPASIILWEQEELADSEGEQA